MLILFFVYIAVLVVAFCFRNTNPVAGFFWGVNSGFWKIFFVAAA